jgi:hypothetical protein
MTSITAIVAWGNSNKNAYKWQSERLGNSFRGALGQTERVAQR